MTDAERADAIRRRLERLEFLLNSHRERASSIYSKIRVARICARIALGLDSADRTSEILWTDAERLLREMKRIPLVNLAFVSYGKPLDSHKCFIPGSVDSAVELYRGAMLALPGLDRWTAAAWFRAIGVASDILRDHSIVDSCRGEQYLSVLRLLAWREIASPSAVKQLFSDFPLLSEVLRQVQEVEVSSFYFGDGRVGCLSASASKGSA